MHPTGHLEAMKEARQMLRAGELHEAEHLIEEMLAGKAKPELSRERLSLRLALSAIDQRDRAEAIRQMRYFVAQAQAQAQGAERPGRPRPLAQSDLHGAEDGIAELLGIVRE
jgi:hypothetical protein